MNRARVLVRITAPQGSMVRHFQAWGVRKTRRVRLPRVTATRPSSGLTKNRARQLKKVSSRPPKGAPMVAPVAKPAENTPRAKPRSPSGKAREMSLGATPSIKAAPIPCTTRQVIRMGKLGLKPPRPDPAAKTVTPAKNSRPGAARSARRPTTICKEALARR
jgi:hypothetical protein